MDEYCSENLALKKKLLIEMIDDGPEDSAKVQKGPEEVEAQNTDSSSILDLENVHLVETIRDDVDKKSDNIFEKFDKLDEFDSLD